MDGYEHVLYCEMFESSKQNVLRCIVITLIIVPGEDPVDIQFKHGSYLFLTTAKTSHLLAENIAVQEQAGTDTHTHTHTVHTHTPTQYTHTHPHRMIYNRE